MKKQHPRGTSCTAEFLMERLNNPVHQLQGAVRRALMNEWLYDAERDEWFNGTGWKICPDCWYDVCLWRAWEGLVNG